MNTVRFSPKKRTACNQAFLRSKSAGRHSVAFNHQTRDGGRGAFAIAFSLKKAIRATTRICLANAPGDTHLRSITTAPHASPRKTTP